MAFAVKVLSCTVWIAAMTSLRYCKKYPKLTVINGFGYFALYILGEEHLRKVGACYNVSKDAGTQCAAQRLCTGVCRADANDVWAAPESLQRDLNGKVLIGLDNRSILIKVVDQHTAAGTLLLQQIPIADEGGEIRTGWIVADIDQRSIDLVPLLLDLVINLC